MYSTISDLLVFMGIALFAVSLVLSLWLEAMYRWLCHRLRKTPEAAPLACEMLLTGGVRSQIKWLRANQSRFPGTLLPLVRWVLRVDGLMILSGAAGLLAFILLFVVQQLAEI